MIPIISSDLMKNSIVYPVVIKGRKRCRVDNWECVDHMSHSCSHCEHTIVKCGLQLTTPNEKIGMSMSVFLYFLSTLGFYQSIFLQIQPFLRNFQEIIKA